MLNVVMVQTENYLGRGVEYVHRLHRQIERNLTVAHRTVLFTDDAASLYPGIVCKPARFKGWWEKLHIFRPGMFADGDRVLFFDLDTVIVGNIDFLAEYQGHFAIPHDFWNPQGLGPAVMNFDPQWAGFIYEEWAAEKFPQTHRRGDQGWIEDRNQGRIRKWVDIMQRLWPRSLVSYKTECSRAIPEGAKVVCFHGKPRPHEVQGWVKEYWNGQLG